jgi:GH25 family lysozyme M1 (1,4-beta-N-acetylmuramidase)
MLAALAGAAGCDRPAAKGEVGRSREAVHTVCGTAATTVPGIDVSTWQGVVDWGAVAGAGIKFAFVRVSHGVSTIDTQFPANWQGTRAHGVVRGAYQYFMPGDDPTAQAQLVVDHIAAAGGLQTDDLPCVIDVENMDGVAASGVMAAIHTWIDFIEAHTGKRPIIYTGSYFWDDHGLDATLAGYPLWTAHYTTAACPLAANPWSSWRFWQYTSTGSVAGISGNVDRDRFDGTVADLQAFIAAGNLQSDAGVDAAPPPADAAAPADGAQPGDAGADGGPPPDDAAAPGDGPAATDGAVTPGDGGATGDADRPRALASGCAAGRDMGGGAALGAAAALLLVGVARRRRGARTRRPAQRQ